MNFILYLLLIATTIVMALSGRIVANPHKYIVLETTFPPDKLQNSQILTVSRNYKKRLLQCALIFSVIGLPIVIIPYDSLILLFFLLLLFSFIGSCYYIQILYIRKMTAVKIKNNWLPPTRPALIDTKLILNKNRKLISIWWFLPSGIFTFSGVFYSWKTVGTENGFWLLSSLSILILGLFLFLYYIISRLPVKPLTSDEKINQQSNDIMRHHWSVLMAVSALAMSPLALLSAVSVTVPYEQVMIGSFIYILIIFIFIGFTFYYLFAMRRKQDQLIAHATEYRYSDDDQFWRYGIYINSNDTRIMVPDRIGMNISVNLGRPTGKIILFITGIVISLSLIAATIPLLISDFSANPFNLSVTHTEIRLSAPLAKTRTIPLKTIDSVQLIESMPTDRIRVYGTETENYLTGAFTVDDRPSYLLVYLNSLPILKLQTKDTVYYYTNKNSKLTKKAFKEIQKNLVE